MYETPADIEDLQARLDHSITQAGAFLRSSFEMPARHLAQRPAASLTYFEGIDVAVIAHGQMRLIGESDSTFSDLDRAWLQTGRESPTQGGGSPVYLRMEPATLYTYARYPDQIGPEAG